MAADLNAIRTKVRRLTRSPSESQLSTTNLDEYINTFILYDFPEHLRLFTFRTTLTFYTEPNIDVYETGPVGTPLSDFADAYITSHDPIYIAGYKAYFTQSRNDFFGNYPALQTSIRIGTGDGATVNFTGTLSSIPVLRYNVLFSSIDANNNGLKLYDTDGDGILYGDVGAASTINYVTGVYDITYTAAPATGEPIYAQVVVYQAARPQSVLFYDNKFTLRPVPDMSYQVRIETYIRPTALINAGDIPELEQYWQWIAYGAAKKVFEDRMDLESVQLIMPEYKQQELLCLRRTIVQQSNERTATIFTNRTDLGASGWNWDNFS